MRNSRLGVIETWACRLYRFNVYGPASHSGASGQVQCFTNCLVFIVIPVIAICVTVAIAHFIASEVPVCFRTVV